MSARRLPACVFALVAACSDELALDSAVPAQLDTATRDDFARLFQIDVQSITDDFDGRPLLPQVFGPFVEGGGFELRMRPTVEVRGRVTAERLGPWATLPSEPRTGRGLVRLMDDRARVLSEVYTDEAGAFTLLGLPGVSVLSFSPDDPGVSAWEASVVLFGDTTQDIPLGVGLPLWGRITQADGITVAGIGVFARSAHGSTTATTYTDEAGWYELRVGPGEWTPVIVGRDGRREPTVLASAVAIAELGARVDADLPPPSSVDFTARIVDADQRPVARVQVLLTATQVVGYAQGMASYQVEVLSDSRGYVDTRVPAGRYDVAVLPEGNRPLSSTLLSDVAVFNGTDLGPLRLDPLRVVQSVLTDPEGAPLADAPVQCSERTPRPRTWTATTLIDGTFQLPLTVGDVRCTFSPPGTAPTLATTVRDTTGADFPDAVTLSSGDPVSGRVVYDPTDGPMPWMLVDLRDEAGSRRGQDSTDTEGNFTLRVQWPNIE